MSDPVLPLRSSGYILCSLVDVKFLGRVGIDEAVDNGDISTIPQYSFLGLKPLLSILHKGQMNQL